MGFGGLIGRLLASLALVVATYNPSGFSLVGWVAFFAGDCPARRSSRKCGDRAIVPPRGAEFRRGDEEAAYTPESPALP